jgi:hypothetical protein
VLPLVNRACAAFSSWLSPACGEAALRLVPDLDEVEALSPERDSLWARLDKATLLTLNEKRALRSAESSEAVNRQRRSIKRKFDPDHDDPLRFMFDIGTVLIPTVTLLAYTSIMMRELTGPPP